MTTLPTGLEGLKESRAFTFIIFLLRWESISAAEVSRHSLIETIIDFYNNNLLNVAWGKKRKGEMPFIIVKLEAKWPQFEAQKLGLQNLDLVCYYIITLLEKDSCFVV